MERPGLPSAPTRVWPVTTLALIGFAANSLLCRAALAPRAIDAWSFTAARLGAGAVTLVLFARATRAARPAADGRAGSPASALALWGYAAAFSLAYLRLPTGIGALVLFASVQVTMIGWSAVTGQRPRVLELLGLLVALAGLVLLTRPGADPPDLPGVALMALAGVAWGAYSLRGRTARAPLLATRDNFVLGLPLALVALLAAACLGRLHAEPRGLALALASGGLASGFGYSLWYRAVPRLGALRAALVQLAVPVLAALAGIAFLREHATLRLLAAGALILGGLALAFLGRRAPAPAPDASAAARDRAGA